MDKNTSAAEPVTPPPFKNAVNPKSGLVTPTGQPLPPKGDSEHKNNPFTIAIDGIGALFTYAKSIAIVIVVLSVLGWLGNAASSAADVLYNNDYSTSQEDTMPFEFPAADTDYNPETIGTVLAVLGVVFLVVLFFILIASFVIYGVTDVAAAAASQHKKVTFGQACSQLFKRFPGYIGLRLLVFVKVFLWSLLFIVPGIIMSVRYSLAGTAYFAKGMKASEAINYSTKITKDNWMTTFASFGWFNLVTLGAVQMLVQTGAQALLFRQFDEIEQSSGRQKLATHALSIVFTVLYFVLIALILGLLALAAIGLYMIATEGY